MVTINRRETSFEGLSEKFENGEDALYSLFSAADKNALFIPKISITPADVAEVPNLAALRQAISSIESQIPAATGRRRYLLKKQLIEMRQDQYVLKNAYRKPIHFMNVIHSFNQISFDENIKVDKNGRVHSDGAVSFFNPRHISALLCNYSRLKEDSWGVFWADGYYLMEDFDNLIEHALAPYPLYLDLLTYKIDGLSNSAIQTLIHQKYGILHSADYISSLWRNKIPKLIATQAEKEYLEWYYTYKERGKWKRCSCCGQVKLAHSLFFSKNNTSKDGYYSICKACRRSRRLEKDKND